jgi:hypothetical protein
MPRHYWVLRLAFAALALVSTAWAAGVPLSLSPERAAVAVYSYEDGDTRTRVVSPGYANPNEYFTHLFASHVSGGEGALVTVGSFRGLHLAALAGFQEVVFFDYDAGLSIFNKLNLELIRVAHDRFEYLSYFATGTLDRGFVAKARSGELPLPEYLLMLGDAQTPDLAARWGRVIGENHNDAFAPEVAREFTESLKRPAERPSAVFEYDDFYFSIRNPLRTFGQPFAEAELLPYTIAGSDRIFEYWKDLLARGKVRVVTGDLSSATDMKALAADLAARGTRVAAVDVSNSLTYAGNHAMAANNLRLLPFSKHGRVLLTYASGMTSTMRYGNTPASIRADGWDYYVLEPDEIRTLGKALTHETISYFLRRHAALNRCERPLTEKGFRGR